MYNFGGSRRANRSKTEGHFIKEKKVLIVKTLANLIASGSGIRKPNYNNYVLPGKNHTAFIAKKKRRKVTQASKRRNRKMKK